ncbi:MAG TPA: hypothetical protein VFZ90_04485, partial [Gemmatimonadales bacterium]
KTNAAVVQLATVVQQSGYEESDAGVPSYQRLGLRVNGRMYADVGFTFEEFGTKRALLGNRQA